MEFWRTITSIPDLFRPRERRASAIGERAQIGFGAIPAVALPTFLDGLKKRFAEAQGVEWVELNPFTRRVVVAFDSRVVTLTELVRVVAEVEAGLPASDTWGVLDAERDLPDDPLRELQTSIEATAAGASIAAGLLLGLIPFVPQRLGLTVATALSIVQGAPLLRRRIDERFGVERSDFLFNLAISGAQAVGARPIASLVDLTASLSKLRDLRARAQLWEDFGPAFCSGQTPLGDPMEALADKRPVPVPKGPIETSRDRSFLIAPGAFALSLLTTRSFRRAVAATFAGFPKPAHLGREVFGNELSRMLARRGTLVLSRAAVDRLDRVDCLVLDESLLTRGAFVLGSVVSADENELEARATVEKLFDRTQPLAEQSLGDTRLLPLGLVVEGLENEITTRAQALASRGGLVLALCRKDEILALADVQTVPQAGVDEVLSSAFAANLRVVVAAKDRAALETIPADQIIPAGEDLPDAIRRLQSDGHVVSFISRGPSPGLAAADVGIGLYRDGEPVPWGAHVLCPDDMGELRTLIEATRTARTVSEQSAQMALGAAAIGTVASAGGLLPFVGRRVMFWVNAVSLIAMINGVRRSSSIAKKVRPKRDPTPWHALEAEAVLARLRSSKEGLSSPERRARRSDRDQPKGAIRELTDAIGLELANPLTPLLAAGAGLSAVVGSSGDAMMVAGVGLLNGAVGGVQRFRAERSIRELERRHRPTARVRRDGSLQMLDARELVRGDIVVFEPGDVVPADCRILEAQSVEVNAASLTGESLPVPKTIVPSFAKHVPDRSSMLYAGTSIAAGRATAIVVATGDEAEAQRGILEKGDPTPKAGVEARLAELMKLTAPAAATAAAAVVGAGLFWGRPTKEIVGTGVSLAVASVPEGLPLLATAAQLASADRLAKRGVLVRNVRCIEALGRVDVICLDKTGTLTEGQIELALLGDGEREIQAADLAATERDVLDAAVAAMPDASEDGRVADPTDAALARAAKRMGVAGNGSHGPCIAEAAFESGRAYHATVREREGTRHLFVKGAPELLIERAARVRRGGKELALTATERASWVQHVGRLGDAGLRVLAIASRPVEDDPEAAAADLQQLVLLGLLAFRDPVRKSAAAAVRGLRDAGVRVVMITGDHPRTATYVAKEVALGAPGEDGVLSGLEIDEMDDDVLLARLPETSVFARVTPAQKSRLVRLYQKAGHAVAMGGDGANDAPAIRAADVGIAMGQGATAAARAMADIIVTDERIDTLVEAIVEGRGMWRSVRDAVSILIGGNLGEIGFTVATGMLSGRPPLNPRQLLLVNFLTDVAPAIAVALRPPEPNTLIELASEGPKTSLEAALDRDIVARAIVTTAGATAAWFAGRLTGSRARASTIGLVALVGSQLGQTLTAGSRPLPVVLTSVGSAALLAGIVQTPGLSNAFGCRPLGPLGWATAVGASAGAAASAPYVRRVIDTLVDRVPGMIDETTRRLIARKPA